MHLRSVSMELTEWRARPALWPGSQRPTPRRPAVLGGGPDEASALDQLSLFSGVEVLGCGGRVQAGELDEYRVALVGRRAPGELAKQHIDLGQHGRVARSVAPGLADGEVEQVGQVWAAQHHSGDTVSVGHHPGTGSAVGDLAQ